jgi:hypothetical protein
VEQEKQRCDQEYKTLQQHVDRSQLNAAMKQLVQPVSEQGDLAFDDHTIAVAARAIALRDKSSLLKMRLSVLKSRRCRSLDNKSQCQEAFLSAVTEKVTYTVSQIQIPSTSIFGVSHINLCDYLLLCLLGFHVSASGTAQ